MKNRPDRIGILGGGQLARMSAYAAYRLGFEVAIMEKHPNSPAGQLTHHEIVGWLHDDHLMRDFAAKSDVITLENEFVDYQRLEFLEALGTPVVPHSATIANIQDKYLQKSALADQNIPVPEFMAVQSLADFEAVKSRLGVPFVLKSRKMGYDGYGNAQIESQADFDTAFKRLTARHAALFAEKFITFHMELAVMIARTPAEIRAYPVVQTIQKNHICHTVIAPAPIDPQLAAQTVEMGIAAVKAVDGFGIYGIEFFLTEDHQILLNEMAPRPHNSGHYTIEACVTSQFENHIRAVLGLPLGTTEMIKPHAVMVNLLGKKEGTGVIPNYAIALNHPELHLHIYGKAQSRIGRKMGHITMLGDNLNPILDQLHTIESQIWL
ncbi:MAG: 5-(carboxyamino)imidazole ribonucleotide synthase [Gemmatimonadetes bacterium]|nr:MAG: 5-(carboxyamino)imidazole ribonucleotide synthase [Gemmatimonadota bacterium]